ncbi:neuferricin-like [Glandiceps talaboti]
MPSKRVLYFSLFIGALAIIDGIYLAKNPEVFEECKSMAGKFFHKVKRLVGNAHVSLVGKPSKVFTVEELKDYTGGPGSKGLYLAVLGNVFDVSAGERHYGPGGGYDFFTGKDGTRGYVTGDFSEKGLIDDISDFTPSQVLEVKSWLDFYHKDYRYVGKLQGRFYDENGNPTEELAKVQTLMAKGLEEKKSNEDEKKKFPPCNSEWTQKSGGRVWCSNKSGGIQRDWVGVPRKMFKPGSTQSRCACVRTSGPPSYDAESKDHPNRGDLDNPNLKEYDNCNPTENSCKLPK